MQILHHLAHLVVHAPVHVFVCRNTRSVMRRPARFAWTQQRVTPTTSCRLCSPLLVPEPDVRLSIASGSPANTAAQGSMSWLATMTVSGATRDESPIEL